MVERQGATPAAALAPLLDNGASALIVSNAGTSEPFGLIIGACSRHSRASAFRAALHKPWLRYLTDLLHCKINVFAGNRVGHCRVRIFKLSASEVLQCLGQGVAAFSAHDLSGAH